jgi:hypothetical protein
MTALAVFCLPVSLRFLTQVRPPMLISYQSVKYWEGWHESAGGCRFALFLYCEALPPVAILLRKLRAASIQN